MNRRDFFLTGIGALAVGGCSSSMGRKAPPSASWGVQMYTVLAQLEADFEGTLRKVAAMGYREIETLGSFGRDPHYVRSVMDRYGLVSPSQHVASDALYGSFVKFIRNELPHGQVTKDYAAESRPERLGALFDQAIAQAKVLGQRYVTWPVLLPEQFATSDALRAYIGFLNDFGKRCADEGVVLAFHNHNREFAALDGQVVYDTILQNTDPDHVKMEMDFYWISKAKVDPLSYLARYPGRFAMVHVKDMAADGDFTTVGQGVIDIASLIRSARSSGVRHFFVEYDKSTDPMRAIDESLIYLRSKA